MSRQKKNQNIPPPTIKIEEPKHCKINILAIITLALVSVLLYLNTLKNDYALDDSMVLLRNSFTQEGVSGIGDIFKYDTFTGYWVFNDSTKTVEQIVKEKQLLPGGRWRPLSLVTFAIEVQLFGRDFYDENGVFVARGCPAVNHFVNIILYCLVVLLLYVVLVKLLPAKSDKWYMTLPFLAALLFAFHPIHTEVVANIKGRDEIMTLMGSLAALWCSLKYVEKNRWYYLILSLLAMLFGLLSKENAITFIAVIPIALYYFTKAKPKQIIISTIPLILGSAIFLAWRFAVLGVNNVESFELMNNPFVNMDFSTKYGTIMVTLLMYLKLLIFPHPLTFDYYPWQIAKAELTDGLAMFSLLVYLAMGIYALYGMFKKKDVASFAILMYLIPLSIVSNIFVGIGTLMNERFIFISSIGFCILVAMIFTDLLPRITKNTMVSTYISSVVLICLFGLSSAKVITRNTAWENDMVLFETDVKVSKNSAKVNCSVGGKLLEKARSETVKDNKELHDAVCQEAIRHLKKSVQIHPTYSDAMNLLGNAYFEYGDIANSLKSYLNVLKYNPEHPNARTNIDLVLRNASGMLTQKKVTSEIPDLLTACNEITMEFPEKGEAYHLMGVIYGRELGNIEASIACLEKAGSCQDFERDASYYKDMGVAYGFSQNFEKAAQMLEKAVELDPKDANMFINLGVTYQYLGNVELAQKYIGIGNELKQQSENDKQ